MVWGAGKPGATTSYTESNSIEPVEPRRVLYSYYTAGSGGVGPTILETSLLLAGEPVVVYANGEKVRSSCFGSNPAIRTVSMLKLIKLKVYLPGVLCFSCGKGQLACFFQRACTMRLWQFALYSVQACCCIIFTFEKALPLYLVALALTFHLQGPFVY